MAIINILLFLIIGAALFVIALPLMILRRLRGNAGRWRGVRKDKKEGEVSISGMDAGSEEKIVGDNVGEYVDFEEVKDDKQ